ncbi:hypothetical protein PMIN06_010391 [Paraphaeosphaeria minitans]
MAVIADHVVAVIAQISPFVVASTILLVSGICLSYLLSAPSAVLHFWASLPTVGIRDEWFSWTLGVIRSFKGTKAMAFEGYEKYSKKGQYFLIPSADRGPMVVIPPSDIKHVMNLPESIIAAHRSQNETIQTDYTLHPKIVYNNFHMNVLRNQLTRNLGALTDAIVEELDVGFSEHWGLDTHWKELEAWPSCMKIVSGASNRAFIGLPCCRDPVLLDLLRDYAMSVFGGATVLNMLPPSFRPVAGQIVKFRTSRLAKKCLNKCLPEIEKRLEHNRRKREDVKYNWEPPGDGLQWVIDEAYKQDDPSQLSPTLIGHRFLFLNFVSMHSTSFTITNTILDLYSSPRAEEFVAGLREECERLLKESGGVWTKEAVNNMVRVDSALRESMRASNFGILALPRKIVSPGGLKLPNGTTIPEGVATLIPMEPIHQDESIYPNAATYNAFRFCEKGALRSILDTNSASEPAKKSAVSLDDSFVSFGIGKHACPGRFFALYEMKLMLAHIVLNYDVEFMKERPGHFNVMWLRLPSDKVKINIRKRAEV